MEEHDSHIEHASEQIEEHAHGSKESWIMGVAFTAALLAAIAALASSFAAHHESEGMLDQIKASDQWAYYQAKGVKADVLQSNSDLLVAIGKCPSPNLAAKIKEEKEDQEIIEAAAHKYETSAERHMQLHKSYAASVTFSQIAIAISAISVLAKRKGFWYAGMMAGSIGVGLLLYGLFL